MLKQKQTIKTSCYFHRTPIVVLFFYMEKKIYLAGGCFWGVQEYFSRLKGVISSISGYANGKTSNPTYKEVKSQVTGHAETVEIVYDNNLISLAKLLEHYLRFVDPYSINKQGEDEGIQYRTGVYYLDESDKETILDFFNKHLKTGYKIEVTALSNFYPAEEYHQDYLKKNPTGYCHINLGLIKKEELK